MKAWIEDDNINYDYIIRYLRDIVPQRDGQLAEMERFAKENDFPISQPESIRMIEVLLKMINAKNILEVGTAIGYSAIRMSKATDASVTTVELIDKTADIAEENIKKAGMEDKIKVIRGDGATVLENMPGEGIFDAIFVVITMKLNSTIFVIWKFSLIVQDFCARVEYLYPTTFSIRE